MSNRLTATNLAAAIISDCEALIDDLGDDTLTDWSYFGEELRRKAATLQQHLRDAQSNEARST